MQLAHGTAFGRGGKGSIFVWAAGNGHAEDDRADYDGYANSPYTIAVGALDHARNQAYYSESGACLFIVMPSSGDGWLYGITTADLSAPGKGYDGRSECTSGFGGTSAAAPLAAGLVALVLQVRPDLHWRDVQGVLAAAAAASPHLAPAGRDEATLGAKGTFGGWSQGTATPHHHGYGFGMPTADAALRVATSWESWPMPQLGYTSDALINLRLALTAANNFTVCYETLFPATVEMTFIEHVQLSLGVTHGRRGDLGITLQSPSGSTSVFALPHADVHANYPLDGWTFTSVHHWGERQLAGPWTLCVADLVRGNGHDAGVLDSLRISVYGH